MPSRFDQDCEIAKSIIEESEENVVFVSTLQRKMSIGYVYARSILDELTRRKLINVDGDVWTKNKSRVFPSGVKQVDEVKKFKAGLHLVVDSSFFIPLAFIAKVMNRLCLDNQEVILIRNENMPTSKLLVSQNSRIPAFSKSETANGKYNAELKKALEKLKAYNLTEIYVYNNDFDKIERIIKCSVDMGIRQIFMFYLKIQGRNDFEQMNSIAENLMNIDKIAKDHEAIVWTVVSASIPVKEYRNVKQFLYKCGLTIPVEQILIVQETGSEFNFLLYENQEVLVTETLAFDMKRSKILEDWRL